MAHELHIHDALVVLEKELGIHSHEIVVKALVEYCREPRSPL